MTNETAALTPLDVYECAIDRYNTRETGIQADIVATRRRLSNLESDLANAQDNRGTAWVQFLDDLESSGDIYRSVFEMQFKDAPEFPHDITRARTADHIAKQLTILDGILEVATSDTFVLSVSKHNFVTQENTTGSSQPREDQLKRVNVNGVRAVVLQAPNGSRVTPISDSIYVPLRGRFTRAKDIVLPISSKYEVETTSKGMDHDSWTEVFERSEEKQANYSVRNLITEHLGVYRTSDDMEFGQYDGVFVGPEAIGAAYDGMSHARVDQRTLGLLGRVLTEKGLLSSAEA